MHLGILIIATHKTTLENGIFKQEPEQIQSMLGL